MKPQPATKYGRTRPLARFIIVLAVGSFFGRELFSYFTSKTGTEPGAGVPQKVISDRVNLKRGQRIQYELVLPIAGRIEIAVRSSRVPISVKLVSAQEPTRSPPTSGGDASRPSAPEPVFWQRNALGISKVETLAAGRWMVFIEASEEPAGRRLETTVTTEVTAL